MRSDPSKWVAVRGGIVPSAALRAGLPEGSFYLATGARPYPPASQLAFHLRAPFQVYGPSLIGREGLQYRYWADPAQQQHGDPAP